MSEDKPLLRKAWNNQFQLEITNLRKQLAEKENVCNELLKQQCEEIDYQFKRAEKAEALRLSSVQLYNEALQWAERAEAELTEAKINLSGCQSALKSTSEQLGQVREFNHNLEAELAEKSRMIAQADGLLLKATQKVGMEPRGCDTPDALADEMVELRANLREAKLNLFGCQSALKSTSEQLGQTRGFNHNLTAELATLKEKGKGIGEVYEKGEAKNER